MEVPFADDDLRAVGRDALPLVRPLARSLDRGLHRLGARVHRERLLVAGQGAELREEGAELVVVERSRGQGQPLRLLVERGENARVPMPLVEGRIGAEHVEVAAALDVPHPDAFATLQDDRQGLVVVRTPALRLLERPAGPPFRNGIGAGLRGALRRLPRRGHSTHRVATHHGSHSP